MGEVILKCQKSQLKNMWLGNCTFSIKYDSAKNYGTEYYRNDPKFSDRQVWANSVDSDQTAQEQGDYSHFLECPNF